MFHLLESGLQRFIFSSAGRCPGIKIVDRNKLQSLSKFAPAVFLTGYREVSRRLPSHECKLTTRDKAMNQRAISIPIITRALASMLENNESATIQSRLQIFMQGRGQDDTALSSDLTPANLRSNIQSSLWRMAQTQLSTTRPKKPPLFLFSESKREQITPTVDSTVQNAISPDHPIEDDDLDSYLGSEDNFEVNLMLQSEIEDSELLELEEAMLLSINSDSSFKDISESTQTTVEFPLLPCSSFTASSRDAEMLFADDD
ncbi:hypothetical protein N7492_002990 [Penicillium capsulatum]|uniref:Uncharacterized protein n=1 Tax=Penicillium capsulatum TaxID=69766 RepID=A0A9W9IJR2_9EURO|nr:hypothetical protein N7492_002990 [Penicillium capsulatum]KAJ6122419.1 hypothetical protein N7512_004884 [Penicillium capsulatum]